MSSSKRAAEPSTHTFRSICILGGDNLGKDEAFRHAAYELGRALAAKKINVVYGGRLRGLKGCTAGTAMTKGRQALGIDLMEGNDQRNKNLVIGNTLMVSTPQERMAQMLYNSDTFIALPGGLETHEDILTLISWANSNFHRKPIGFLNTGAFYNGLLSFLDQTMQQGFTPQGIKKIMTQSTNPYELIERMQSIAFELRALEEKEQKKKKVERNDRDNEKKKEPDTTLRL